MKNPMEKTIPFMEYMRMGEVKRLVHRFDDELKKKGAHAVAVTGLDVGEGRTFLVAVLAVGSAFFLKKKVLVIDTSTQPHQGKMQLNRIFDEAHMNKAVDVITPKASEDGTADAADFELKHLLEHYRDKYDLILFDTSAIHDASYHSMDPIIVAKTAGYTIMTLSKTSVASANFRKIRQDMQEWGIHVLGAVYNFGSLK